MVGLGGLIYAVLAAIISPDSSTIRLIINNAAQFVAGLLVLQAARSILAVPADFIVRTSNRRPVLFLRSFRSDLNLSSWRITVEAAKRAMTLGVYQFWGGLGGELIISFEERLLHVLEPIGPMIAIGWDEPTTLGIGAPRITCPRANWKECVRDLMDRAALVVLRPDSTEGVTWELDEVLRRIPGERFLMVFGSRPALRYSFFQKEYGYKFPHGLPESRGDVLLVHFDSDWGPTVVENRLTRRCRLFDVLDLRRPYFMRSLFSQLTPVLGRFGCVQHSEVRIFGIECFILLAVLLVYAVVIVGFKIVDLIK